MTQVYYPILKSIIKLLFVIFCLTGVQSHALVGGDPADASSFPGLVILNAGGDKTPSTRRNCTGIVLESKRVLTNAEECLHTYTIGNFIFIPLLIPFSPESILVHPISKGEFNSDILYPVENQLTSPGIRITEYKYSDYGSLGILYLEDDIGVEPATLYEGENNFITMSGTAIGWEKDQNSANQSIYVINQLPINFTGTGSQGETGPDIADNDCIESSVYSRVELCAGYLNGINYFEWTVDKGAPVYRQANGKAVVIGLLRNPSQGVLYNGEYYYERYIRTSIFVDFIKQHAPNTRFQKLDNHSQSSFPLLLIEN